MQKVVHNSVKIDMEESQDEEVDIVNLLSNHNKQMQQRSSSLPIPSRPSPPLNISSNLKNSVRGSELSSEKSNEKRMFRRANTESY